MSLRLVLGPPNSGRAGAILDGMRAAADREPVLLVPGGDDVSGFERELSAGGGAAIGLEITTFDRLFEDLAELLALPAGPPLSPPPLRLDVTGSNFVAEEDISWPTSTIGTSPVASWTP